MFEVSIVGASVLVLVALIALESFFEWRKRLKDRGRNGSRPQAPVVPGARKAA